MTHTQNKSLPTCANLWRTFDFFGHRQYQWASCLCCWQSPKEFQRGSIWENNLGDFCFLSELFIVFVGGGGGLYFSKMAT